MYSDVARDRLADGDTAVAESMAGQVAVLADLASAAAAPPHAAQLVQSSLLLPLAHHLRQQAEQAALSHFQAQTLQKLLCSRSSGSKHGDSAYDSFVLLRAAVSRILTPERLDPPGGEPQSREVAADLLVVQALLHSRTVSLPAVLDAALLHVLAPHAGTVLQQLLTPGHTLQTFSAACKPLVTTVSATAVQNLSSFVQLVLNGYSASKESSGDVPESTCGEGILLLLLGHAMLPEGSTAGAEMLRSPAASALQRLMPSRADTGLLYMLGVLFRDTASAASAAAADVSVEAAQALLRAPALVPSAAHCCRACIESPAELRSAASVAHCESIMCSIFELAVPHIIGATRTSGAVPGARALQTVAAATWQQLVQPLTAAARTLTPDLPAELMRLLVLWHSRCSSWGGGDEQSPWTVSPAQASEPVPGNGSPAAGSAAEAGEELLPFCHLAGATANTALGILDVAGSHSDASATDSAVSALLNPPHHAGASPAAACGRTPSDLQASLPRPQLLLAASVVLRSRQLKVLQSLRRYLPWLALVAAVTDDEWPTGFRHALMRHMLAAAGSSTGEAGEVCRQLLRLALAADDSSSVALASLVALLSRASPAISSAAVHAFTSCASELPQHVVATSDGQPGVGLQAVAALAPHVCLQARSGHAAAAAVRDEVAVVVLQDLCKRAPLLAEHAPIHASDDVSAACGVAAAMQCAAQLYVAVVDSPEQTAEDPESAQLLTILVGGEVPPDTALAAADGSGADAGQPANAGPVAGAPAEGGSGSRPDAHAALVYDSASSRVQQAFRAAVAHQLRPARAVTAMATAASAAAGSVLHLLLAASTVSQASQAGEDERLQGLVEARLAAATVAVEGRTEDVCEALVAASAQLAGGAAAAEGEEGSAQQRIAAVMELGWSDPRKAGTLFPPVQEAAAGPVAMDSTALVAVELYMQLRELRKHGAGAEEEGGAPAVVQRIERLLLRLLLCAGTCMHVARMVQAPADTAARWLPGSANFWQLVAQAALLHVGDASAAQAVEEFTTWSEELGVPAMHAAMGLLQYRETSAAMHAAGARIALSPALLAPASDIDNTGCAPMGRGVQIASLPCTGSVCDVLHCSSMRM